MERISGEGTIEFEFNISNGPSYPLDARAVTEIEGRLVLRVGDTAVFDEQDILLAEFATCLHRWLAGIESSPNLPLIYESMDYEESPILRIEEFDGSLLITSTWLEKVQLPADEADLQSLTLAAKLFLANFESVVPGISAYYG